MPDRPDVDAQLEPIRRAEEKIAAELKRGQEALAAVDKQLAKLQAEREGWVDFVERMDHALEATRGALGIEHRRLSSVPNRATVRHKMQVDDMRTVREVGRKLGTDHPFKRALRAANITVTEWAKAHRVTRSHVKSWMLDGKGGRSIPRAFANQVEKEFKLPATSQTWKNGVKG